VRWSGGDERRVSQLFRACLTSVRNLAGAGHGVRDAPTVAEDPRTVAVVSTTTELPLRACDLRGAANRDVAGPAIRDKSSDVSTSHAHRHASNPWRRFGARRLHGTREARSVNKEELLGPSDCFGWHRGNRQLDRPGHKPARVWPTNKLSVLNERPLSLVQLNQRLVLGHEAEMSEGCFHYYWLSEPGHPCRPTGKLTPDRRGI